MPDRDQNSSLEHRIVRLEERQKQIRSELEQFKTLEKRVAEIDMTLQRVQWRQQQDAQTQQPLLAQGTAVGNYIEPTLLRVIAVLAAALVGAVSGNAYFGG